MKQLNIMLSSDNSDKMLSLKSCILAQKKTGIKFEPLDLYDYKNENLDIEGTELEKAIVKLVGWAKYVQHNYKEDIYEYFTFKLGLNADYKLSNDPRFAISSSALLSEAKNGGIRVNNIDPFDVFDSLLNLSSLSPRKKAKKAKKNFGSMDAEAVYLMLKDIRYRDWLETYKDGFIEDSEETDEETFYDDLDDDFYSMCRTFQSRFTKLSSKT